MNKASSLASPSRLAITYRAVCDLIPDPRNARTHPKRQIDQIRASIEAFGFTNPILADPEGHIIAGHGRLQAARMMGLAELAAYLERDARDLSKWASRHEQQVLALDEVFDLAEQCLIELMRTGEIEGQRFVTVGDPFDIKRKQIENRIHELEEEISRVEASIAHCETELQNFISADESQRQSQQLDQHKLCAYQANKIYLARDVYT